MTDLVTIVTPIYNSSQFLGKSIQSVLSQTYENWEMIIVDDCSQDNSLAIAENYAAVDQRIRAFKLPKNSGAAAARNAAILHSWIVMIYGLLKSWRNKLILCLSTA